MTDQDTAVDEDGHHTDDQSLLSRRGTLGLLGVTGLSAITGQAAGDHDPADDGFAPWRHWSGDVNANGHDLYGLNAVELGGSEAITDFAGEGLSIENGVLQAPGGGGDAAAAVNVIDVDDYGADPTGVEASDEAFDAAVEAAEDGDWIVLTNGTYYFAEQHEIRKELIIYGAGGTIESDVHPDIAFDDSYPDGTQSQAFYPLFYFRGDRGDRVELTEDVQKESDQIPVADTAPFEVGGGVLLNDQNLSVEAKPGRSYEPTVSTIREIEDGVLYLDVPARYDYDADADDVSIAPLEMLDNCGFVECHFRNRNEFYWDDDRGKVMGGFRHAMAMQYCRKPVAVNCSVSGYDTHAWTPRDCLEAYALNVRVERPMNVNGSHGEPFHIDGSTNVTIINPVVRGARRAIDIRSGCKDVNVYNPDITGVSLIGLSFHGGSVRGNMNVYGGRVSCKPIDPTQDDHGGDEDRRWEYQLGQCFNDTSADGRLYVQGTSFVTLTYAGALSGAGTTLEGCDITTVPAHDENHFFDEVDYLQVLRIQGEKTTVRNTTIRANPNGTDQTHAVYVDGGNDVDLDVDIQGEFSENPITITESENIHVDARLSDAEYENEGILLEGALEDVSITGTARHGGNGVEFADDVDATHVTISDFIHYGDYPTIRVHGDASIQNLRLTDITAEGGTNNFEFGGAFIDGLWIMNCILNELRGLHADQEDDENTVLFGNRTGWNQ